MAASPTRSNKESTCRLACRHLLLSLKFSSTSDVNKLYQFGNTKLYFASVCLEVSANGFEICRYLSVTVLL
jgi:hypothetical protein